MVMLCLAVVFCWPMTIDDRYSPLNIFWNVSDWHNLSYYRSIASNSLNMLDFWWKEALWPEHIDGDKTIVPEDTKQGSDKLFQRQYTFH